LRSAQVSAEAKMGMPSLPPSQAALSAWSPWPCPMKIISGARLTRSSTTNGVRPGTVSARCTNVSSRMTWPFTEAASVALVSHEKITLPESTCAVRWLTCSAPNTRLRARTRSSVAGVFAAALNASSDAAAATQVDSKRDIVFVSRESFRRYAGSDAPAKSILRCAASWPTARSLLDWGVHAGIGVANAGPAGSRVGARGAFENGRHVVQRCSGVSRRIKPRRACLARKACRRRPLPRVERRRGASRAEMLPSTVGGIPMRPLFASVRVHMTWMLLAVGALLASCGGGGGSSSAATQYTSVAMAGELLTYTVDPVALTYSYTITESQFGLTGKTGSGTLVRNLDGSYSPSGIPNARIVILPNGLL